MKGFLIGVLLISSLTISACAGVLIGMVPVQSETNYEITNEPVEVVETISAETETENSIEETQEPAPEQELSFDPVEYFDEAAGIVMYHPADWTVLSRENVGDRGSQAALLSVGSTLEQVAEDGARITLVMYKWDPKNDLAAFVTQRETAWEASGFKFAREESFLMKDGREVVLYMVTVGEGSQALFAFTTAGEDYLQLAGEGDLALCKEIISTIQSLE